MIHDRVAFGGALVSIGLMYLWLTAGPMSQGERWAWELTAVSGAVGFASFLAYLGYGYLDTWHGVATVALAPIFVVGLIVSGQHILWLPERSRWLKRPEWLTSLRDRQCVGRLFILVAATGMVCGGLTILAIGMTCVFVPEDLVYLQVGQVELDALNPRLVPLIAHDRAGFGGAVCCCGVLLAGIAWQARLDHAARHALAVAGLFGFGSAILIHPAIGYNDWRHLTPAIGGALVYAFGVWLTRSTLSPP